MPGTKRIDIIAGARPNFMKVAPIIKALQAREAAGGPLRYRLVHTGQHYEARLSGDFCPARDPGAGCEPGGRVRNSGRADGGDHDPLRAVVAR